MPDTSAGWQQPVSIEFGAVEWREEVERYDRRSPAHAQAQSARKTIEAYTTKLDWKRCKRTAQAAQNCRAAGSCTSRSANRAPLRHVRYRYTKRQHRLRRHKIVKVVRSACRPDVTIDFRYLLKAIVSNHLRTTSGRIRQRSACSRNARTARESNVCEHGRQLRIPHSGRLRMMSLRQD